VYIADTTNHVVRLVAGGNIRTIAGNGLTFFTGDNGPAVNAGMFPFAVAVDSALNLYIADAGTNRIRKVSAGYITTVAGNGTLGFSGDNGSATSAELNTPEGVAVDSAGNLYIADTLNNRVRMVKGGVITTLAGNGPEGFIGDNAPAPSAGLAVPLGVAVDSAGNIYIADYLDYRIRKISNNVITTVAGTGFAGGDNGPATNAQLDMPFGIALSAGTLYIADSGNRRIRSVSNGVIKTVAGGGYTGAYNSLSYSGPAASSALYAPESVALDSAGNLFICDKRGFIFKVSNGMLTTLAGNGTVGFAGDNGPAVSAVLNFPYGVAADSAGNLYIADYFNDRIRRIADGVITTVAGNGMLNFGDDIGDNGPAVSAVVDDPLGVALDSAGNLYIAEIRIRKVSGGVITTVAGTDTQGYSGDNGPATSAQLNQPSAVAVDSAGAIYIADTNNNCIRKVSGGVITTIAGNGVAGFRGDGGPATSAELFAPSGVAVDSAGNVYVADQNNNRIRLLTPNPPASQTIAFAPLSNVYSAPRHL
jgi:sugar lactone lactonase YvrE